MTLFAGSVANEGCSFTKFLHTKEGQAFAEKVWDETYDELPVDADAILKAL